MQRLFSSCQASLAHCQRHRLNDNSVISEDVLLIHPVRINFQRRGGGRIAGNKTKLKARREGGGGEGICREFPNSLATRRPRGDNFQRGGLAVRQLVCFSFNAVGINEQLIPEFLQLEEETFSFENPLLSLVHICSIAFVPSVVVDFISFSLSLSPLQQPFNHPLSYLLCLQPLLQLLAESLLLRTPISINLFSPLHLFGNRSTTIRRRRRRRRRYLSIYFIFPSLPLFHLSPPPHLTPPSPSATCANIVSDGEQIPQSSALPPRRNRPLRVDTSNTLTHFAPTTSSLSLSLSLPPSLFSRPPPL